MDTVKINNHEYEIVENYREGLDLEELESKATSYFQEFDYIVGDWAYEKLRLKGFYNSKKKEVKAINNYKNKDDYFKKNCAYDCKYFILKKI